MDLSTRLRGINPINFVVIPRSLKLKRSLFIARVWLRYHFLSPLWSSQKKKKNEKKEKKLLGDPTPTGKVLSRKRRGADKALGTRYIVVFANE